MTESKIYRVIKVISPYQIVINAGLDDGIDTGEQFLIYDLGEMLKDPDSGEDLERLEIVRGTGKVIHVQSRVSTIESDMKTEEPVTIKRRSNLGSMRAFFGDIEETEISRRECSFDEPQIGDFARSMD